MLLDLDDEMMCYIFLVISIVVVVSGQEENNYSSTFRDRDVNALIEELHKLSFENKEIVNVCSRIAKDNENLKTLIHTFFDKNEEFEQRFNFIEKNIPFSNNQQKNHRSDSNIHDVLPNNLTGIIGQGHRLIAKKNIPMLMPNKIYNNNPVKDKRLIQPGTSGKYFIEYHFGLTNIILELFLYLVDLCLHHYLKRISQNCFRQKMWLFNFTSESYASVVSLN